MTGKIMAAAVQMNSNDDPADNLRRAERLVERAAERGARVVALPENFAYLRSEAEPVGYRQPLDGELTAWAGDLARRCKIHLLAGSFPEDAGAGKVHNSGLLFDPEGNRIAHYRKIHLFDATLRDGTVLEESRFVEPGDKVVTASIDGVTVGLSICYDLRFPELYRRLAAEGARLIFVPAAFTLQTGRDHWEVLLRARAIENQVYVVAPAQFGQHSPRRASHGRSMIVDPWGTILATAPDRETVVTAELDFEYLESVRALMPCAKHVKLS